MLNIIQEIITCYSGILTFFTSICMVVVTTIYVIYTKHQSKSAAKSTELMLKQIITEKQPCILPTIIETHGVAFDTSSYTRIQFNIQYSLENIGDAPAISIYTFSEIELQHSFDKESGQKQMLTASLLPSFVPALPAGKKQIVDIHFETNEVLRLIEELRVNQDMNWKRLTETPYQSHYIGAKLVTTVLFKNIMGQWSKCTLINEISWFTYKVPPKQITKNINENTIPPKRIKAGDQFKAQIVPSHYSPYLYNMISEDEVNRILAQFINESPWLDDITNQ